MLPVFLVRYQKMITLFSSLQSLTLFIFTTALSLPTSKGEDHRHEICSSSSISCGKLQNVGYPFWGLGRPQYCGHPALELECPKYSSSEYPVLEIGEVYYEILGIDNNTLPNITIQLREFNKSFGYPHRISNKDFDKIFHFSGSVENITLYECCDEEIEDIPSRCKKRCKKSWGNDSLGYYPDKRSCTKNFQHCLPFEVPVTKEFKIRLQKNKAFTVSEVLQWGFKVDYLNSYACSKCKNSSGTCGSNLEDFACFHQNHPKPDWKLIVGLVVPGAFIIGVLSGAFWICIKRKFYSPVLQSSKLPFVPMKSDIEVGNSFYGLSVLPYDELREATNNFDESQELGDGGFGVVYYGKLKDGREVAVKRLFEKNYKQIEQFMNEIEILTHLRHPNLVTLYGCTSRSSRELLLVYDFIPNGTVADHLYGERKGSETLSWDIRMKIATETARALSYLHASEIIHRDVKTNNILLDNNFSVKVGDFGLSRLFPYDATHVSTVPQGTPGYLDPQYHKNYQVTNKSDVYSFGVVLVELISSLPAVDISRHEDEINLYDYAMSRIQNGILSELVDQNLGFESDFKVNRMITLVAELAFRCLQQEKELRPTMFEILEALEEIGSTNYKALEAEDTSLSKSASKTMSITMENHIESSLRNTHHPPSPNSVTVSWVSRSTASNTST